MSNPKPWDFLRALLQKEEEVPLEERAKLLPQEVDSLSSLEKSTALKKILNMMVFDMLKGLSKTRSVDDIAWRDGYLTAVKDLQDQIKRCTFIRSNRKK